MLIHSHLGRPVSLAQQTCQLQAHLPSRPPSCGRCRDRIAQGR